MARIKSRSVVLTCYASQNVEETATVCKLNCVAVLLLHGHLSLVNREGWQRNFRQYCGGDDGGFGSSGYYE